MTQSNLVSMAQQFSGLPMKSLIGSPLQAAAEANAMMSHTQTEFLLNTCFNKDVKKDSSGTVIKGNDDKGIPTYSPIMVTMTLSRSVYDKKTGEAKDPVVTYFELPILTLLPLNSLAVDDVNVNFEMEVKSSFSQDEEQSSSSESQAEGGFTASYKFGLFKAEVHGSVSSSSKSSSSKKEHYEKSNRAKYEISVHAGQIPLPEGVTTIIQAFTENISPIAVEGEDSNNAGGTSS